jgi:hypothetical protein
LDDFYNDNIFDNIFEDFLKKNNYEILRLFQNHKKFNPNSAMNIILENCDKIIDENDYFYLVKDVYQHKSFCDETNENLIYDKHKFSFVKIIGNKKIKLIISEKEPISMIIEYENENGYIYEGNYTENFIMNGSGKMTYSNKNVYEGEFYNDKFSGSGKMTYSNKNVYEGEFYNDKFSGYGNYHENNYITYSGLWKNGMKNGFFTINFYGQDKIKKTITGTFLNDKKHGCFKIKIENKDLFFGDYDKFYEYYENGIFIKKLTHDEYIKNNIIMCDICNFDKKLDCILNCGHNECAGNICKECFSKIHNNFSPGCKISWKKIFCQFCHRKFESEHIIKNYLNSNIYRILSTNLEKNFELYGYCRKCESIEYIGEKNTCTDASVSCDDERNFICKSCLVKKDDKFIKFCPKCKKTIYKDGGCNHMACICGYEWCWICKRKYFNFCSSKLRRIFNCKHVP